MNSLKNIFLKILNEIEKNDNILNITGGRGYGTGKARVKEPHSVTKNLGNEEGEEEEIYILKPVKVSKVFRRRKNER